MLKEKIHHLANIIYHDVVKNRRHLHANPELSFHEYQTVAFVAAKLDELDITH